MTKNQILSRLKAKGHITEEEYHLLKEERPQGKWLPMEVSSGRDAWKCSVCGRRARGKLNNLPFCHCGAKMKGGAK